MTREEFINVAEETLDSLPEEFRSHIQNVAILVEDYPPKQSRSQPGQQKQLLLGIFHGVPATKKSVFDLSAEEERAEVSKSHRSPKGNRHMRRILNQAANAAAKSKGTIFEIVYRRLVSRLGHNQTIGAIAHRLCRHIWIILHRGVRYEERGPSVSAKTRRHRTNRMIRELRNLGYRVEPLVTTAWEEDFSTLRTELFELAVVPALPPHPVQVHRQLARHRYFGNLSSAPHGKVEEPAAPLWLASHRDLRRFHQQKPEQRIALLADMPQSGFSCWLPSRSASRPLHVPGSARVRTLPWLPTTASLVGRTVCRGPSCRGD